MPMTSQAQRKAMWAASSGKSTAGIPQSVGKEFAEHDQGGKLPDYAGAAKRGLKRRALAGTKPRVPDAAGPQY